MTAGPKNKKNADKPNKICVAVYKYAFCYYTQNCKSCLISEENDMLVKERQQVMDNKAKELWPKYIRVRHARDKTEVATEESTSESTGAMVSEDGSDSDETSSALSHNQSDGDNSDIPFKGWKYTAHVSSDDSDDELDIATLIANIKRTMNM